MARTQKNFLGILSVNVKCSFEMLNFLIMFVCLFVSFLFLSIYVGCEERP